MDELSLSTAEILAGGLKDLKRARVFGTRTPGAALPSMIVLLPNGDRFQFAMANYISAGGKPLEGEGVIPDVETPLTRAALLEGRDPAVEAAVRWIRSASANPDVTRNRDSHSRQSRGVPSMRRPFALAAIALLIILARPLPAQAPSDLPKAETVLDQYVEATGGKAAYEKLKNRTISGTIEVVGANVKGTIKMSQAAPNRLVAVTDIEGVGKFTEGTNGKSAWKLSTVLGDRLLDGDEKETFLRRATFNDEILWKGVYDKVECTGIEDVAGKPAYKLVLTPKTGKPVTKFYDKASHLIVKEMTSDSSPMGDIEVESYPADYKKVNGILIPFALTQKVAGQSIELKMTEIKHNVDLPDDTFKRPASLDEAEKKKGSETAGIGRDDGNVSRRPGPMPSRMTLR